MSPPLDMAGLLASLEAGDTLLVPSEIAARALRQNFARRQHHRGLQVWEPPAVLTWRQWTQTLWTSVLSDGIEDRVLLNRLQEEALWKEVIQDTPTDVFLPTSQRAELAGLAFAAHALVAPQVPPSALSARLGSTADSFDSRSFARWQRTFAARCEAERLLPRASLDWVIQSLLEHRHIPAPACLRLTGFERLTPAQRALLESLRRAGCDVHTHAVSREQDGAATGRAMQIGTAEEELRSALLWMRERLEQHRESDLRCALVISNAETERAVLEPLLRQILAPELEAITADLSSTPWHFSTGVRLGSVSLAQHALLLLQWAQGRLPVEDIGALLLSPYLSHTDSLETRATFEFHRLRRSDLPLPELTVSELLRLSHERHHGSRSTLELSELRAFAQMLGSRPLDGTGTHGDWAEWVRKLLAAVGWPGTRTLSPMEFRATEVWDGVLDLLATLDLYGNRISLEQFCTLLEREVQRATVPDLSPGSSLEIAALPELEGCLLDAVVVVHATDQHLPAAEHTTPLLGWGLQRALDLPGADLASTRDRARQSLSSLGRRCGELLLTAPEIDENGPLRLTHFVTELGLVPMLRPSLGDPLAPFAEPVEQISLPDDTPLPPLPSPDVPGGARVLELQAACGFRAFASIRLGASGPETRTLGLNARELGNLLHRTMENLWSELRTQQVLRQLTEAQRKEAVARAVQLAFTKTLEKHKSTDPWTAEYLDLLQTRLTNLVQHWLPYELSRGDFSVVAPEHKQVLDVGPLHLSVRPDRIDKVAEGVVFIDYKTSFDLSADHWLGERPDAPQLPLYATLAETDELRGLAFARMRPGKDMGWISLEDRTEVFPPARNKELHDLSTQLELWRAELARLAEEFANGNAEVAPKTYPRTCQYCAHRLLCRLNPAELLANECDAEPEFPLG